MILRRTGFRPYVMRHCEVCNGDRPHTAKGVCQGCKQRAKLRTPLVRKAAALRRTKPRVSDTKRAAKDALPIAQAIVIRRAKGRCECCGEVCLPAIALAMADLSDEPGQCHHRKPRQAGGSSSPAINTASNLLWLKPSCHRRIESERTWALEQGFLVLQSADPAKVAAQRYDGLVLLADDGSMRPSLLEPGDG